MYKQAVNMIWRVSALSLCLIGFSAIYAQVQAQSALPPAHVRVAKAEKQAMTSEIKVPGTVVSRNDSMLAAQIAGPIVWLADVGTVVKAGDVIARIDDRDLQLEKRQNVAQIKRLEARLRYEEGQVKRFGELAATNHTPQSRFEEAVSNRDMAEQELEEAHINLEKTELSLERTSIRAPFPGQVVERLAQIGEYATPGREIARLVDTQHVEVRAQVPIAHAKSLKTGQTVTLALAGTFIETPIRTVITVGDEVTRSLEVRLDVPVTQPIGSAVEVRLPIGAARTVVAVPRDALILRQDGTFVWTVNGEGNANRVAVTTGAARGDLIEISGEIAAGAQVIIRGGERLRPGQPVRIAGAA